MFAHFIAVIIWGLLMTWKPFRSDGLGKIRCLISCRLWCRACAVVVQQVKSTADWQRKLLFRQQLMTVQIRPDYSACAFSFKIVEVRVCTFFCNRVNIWEWEWSLDIAVHTLMLQPFFFPFPFRGGRGGSRILCLHLNLWFSTFALPPSDVIFSFTESTRIHLGRLQGQL